MAENLQYKLYNASIAPPGNAWSKIAEELDKEAEHRLQQKLHEAVLTPPPAAWQNILEVLNEASSHQQAKVIPITRRWGVAAAAILAGIIVLGGLYYFMWRDNYSNNTASGNNTQTQTNSDNDKNNSTTQTPAPSANTQLTDEEIAKLPVARPVVAAISFSPRIRHSRVKNSPETEQVNIDNAIGAQVSLQPGANIPPQQYLTVAAPNGEPAKISARFTDAVTYAMADVPADNMTAVLKTISWKQRLNKWRNKLMKTGAFIPAGTNFLDIVELEELLKD